MATPDPVALRRHVYDVIFATGHIPMLRDIAKHFDITRAAAKTAVASLQIGKTILPEPETGEIWMAGPFASDDSAYLVIGNRVAWSANCAWDMLGIAALAQEPVRIEAECTDCGEPITIHVDPETGPAPESLGLVHFLVPAARWYEDIGFT